MITQMKNALKISVLAGAMAAGIFTISHTTFAAELHSETTTAVQAENGSNSLGLGLLNEISVSGETILGDTVSTAAGAVGASADQAVSKVNDVVSKAPDAAAGVVDSAVDQAVSKVNDVVSKAPDAAAGVVDSAAGQAVTNVLGIAANASETAIGAINTAPDQAIASVNGIASEATGTVNQLAAQVNASITSDTSASVNTP
ncbi:hypothetical protein KZ483_07720 [Paenibacillus sp. sptzw28]|uniref:hypothetical protein n=1 Tax=Paenibacillus sp. sptzw28 TaxID=715179 RepID=UPI001C6E7ECE|nr:hypothetical protein [Paenibacillus sp. sptzw28]QYR22816.1 hypothetical protein KZ483_07720 [Paenibacillus sp. sptzw28]